jgi:hypothetical protein
MSMQCPAGHESQTTDFCDECGAPMGGPATAPVTVVAPAAPAAAAEGAPASANACPQCASPRTPEDKFCEICGYDFLAKQAAAAPTPEPAPAPAAAAAPAAAVAAAPEGAPAGATWRIVVRADRTRYDADVPDAPPFPDNYTERVFALKGDRLLIGRESQSRGIHPEVDLSGSPEDTGVSRSHATLVRQHDGSYAIVDDGSTNGTHLNDGTDPIARGVAVPLTAGDRIYIGAWTMVLVERTDGSGETSPEKSPD